MWYVYINRTSKEAPFSFENLIALQNQVLSELEPVRGSALLFAEMEPTVTLGARQVHDENQEQLIDSLKNKLAKKGVSLVPGERGGKETWHGPGQWVCFVLAPLEKFSGDSKGVRKAVYLILEKVLKVVQEYEPLAKIEEAERLGIWSPLGKLVSIGIKVKKGYITSGFAMNCIPHELSFFGIDPCGLGGVVPDFLFTSRVPQENWEQEFLKIVEKMKAVF